MIDAAAAAADRWLIWFYCFFSSFLYLLSLSLNCSRSQSLSHTLISLAFSRLIFSFRFSALFHFFSLLIITVNQCIDKNCLEMLGGFVNDAAHTCTFHFRLRCSCCCYYCWWNVQFMLLLLLRVLWNMWLLRCLIAWMHECFERFLGDF